MKGAYVATVVLIVVVVAALVRFSRPDGGCMQQLKKAALESCIYSIVIFLIYSFCHVGSKKDANTTKHNDVLSSSCMLSC